MRYRIGTAGCALLIATFTPREVGAQTDKDFAIWAGVFATGQVHANAPSLTSWLDVHARRGESGTTLILRPGLGYLIRPWVSVWLGYAWVPEFIDATSERLDEHRIWEQLIMEHKTSYGFLFQSRSRFEQRFSRGAVAHRFRQGARFNYQPKQSIPIGVVLWDELFLGITGNAWAKQGFDQNRLFVGPAVFGFDGIFRAEVGYQLVNQSRTPNRLIHILAINLFVNLKGKH
jgi:hypothetical protein